MYIHNKFLIIAVIAVFALLLSYTSAFARKGDNSYKCEPVTAVWYQTEFLEGEENCDVSFSYCIVGTLEGSLNGELTYYGNEEREKLDPFETGLPINTSAGEERFTSPYGDINMITHNYYDFDSNVWTELLVMYDGTGIYEGATARMVFGTKLPPTKNEPVSFEGPAVLTGYICMKP